jgi:hypothetical protein
MLVPQIAIIMFQKSDLELFSMLLKINENVSYIDFNKIIGYDFEAKIKCSNC